MGTMSCGRLLQWLGTLVLTTLVGAGCGGDTGGDENATSRIVLLINRASAPEQERHLVRQNAFPITAQQVSPGDPGFITRLDT